MWRRGLIIAGVTLVLVVVAGWWTARRLTSPLSVLNILNPTNTQPLPQTAVTPRQLVAQPIAVPSAWRTNTVADGRTLNIPEGFSVSVFASGFSKARLLAWDEAGRLLVSDMGAGTIVVLPDENGDGVADRAVTVARDLDRPHGMALHNGWLYVAETSKVVRLKDKNGDGVYEQREVVVPNLPTGGNHVTRTIAFGPDDGKMYVSVGSSCNVCEDDNRRAAVLRYDENGKNEFVFAAGLRNSVGLTFHPETGELWATENGRDLLGDDIPPEEVNIIREGKHYGWPYCYGDRVADAKYDRPAFCATTEPPVITMQAHSAPLGLRFAPSAGLPEQYRGALFMAFHGSWNRREPTGYKVVMATLSGNTPAVSDVVTGWLVGGKAWGRPVDVLFAPDGKSLYISDDYANVIYRVAVPATS